jgi:hypothetical protein
LQKLLEDLAAQLWAQMRHNECLSYLNQEQGKRLLVLEHVTEIWNQKAKDQKKILETISNDWTTICCVLLQNSQLKEQLAKLQDGFIRLTNNKVELTSALHSEKHMKTELGKKVGQLQEELGQLNETMEGEKPRGLWSPAATRPVPGPPAAVHGHLPTTNIP